MSLLHRFAAVAVTVLLTSSVHAQESSRFTGMWESVDRTKEGVGTTIQIQPGETARLVVGPMLDGTYRTDGTKLIVSSGSAEPVTIEFVIAGETMTQRSAGSEKTFTRLGSGAGITGTWKSQENGATAYTFYSPSGAMQFRRPTKVLKATYLIDGENLMMKIVDATDAELFFLRDGELVHQPPGRKEERYRRAGN